MKSFTVASPATKEPEKPFVRRVLPDMLAFGIGLGVAYFLKWETADLVWSLWLCSLVLGYTTLLSAIGGGACEGLHAIRQPDFEKKLRLPAVLFGSASGLFFLGFFSLHFCGFHAGHSVFLRQLFPVEGMPEQGFGDAFVNPPLLWVLVFRHLIRPYGVFLIPAIVAERRQVFLPFLKAVRAVKAGGSSDGPTEDGIEGKNRKDSHLLRDAMGRPYVNVVRMHLLIFFFGFCHALKIDSFVVYVVVYFVYFFPWSEIKKLRASNKTLGESWGQTAIRD